MIKYLTMTIGKQKNIALIAHDGKKQDMLKWCMDNKEILRQHNLSGTGTTARMIADYVGLKIKVVLCDARWSDAKDCSYGLQYQTNQKSSYRLFLSQLPDR